MTDPVTAERSLIDARIKTLAEDFCKATGHDLSKAIAMIRRVVYGLDDYDA